MSVEQNIPNNETVNHRNEDNEEGDAVHGRFRQTYVHCEDCDSDIAWDHAAIKKHYNSLHPSDRYCRYCKGKVFMYRKITPVDDDGVPQERLPGILYHKCEHEEQAKTDE